MIVFESIPQQNPDGTTTVTPAGDWPQNHFGCLIKDGKYYFAETPEETADLVPPA